jgi:hypothetical protein
VEGIHFPNLKQLALEYVRISEHSLHAMISSCPVLECLLLRLSFGFGCLRISSSSLKSIGVGTNRYRNQPQLREIIIVDAPSLERLLFLESYMSIYVFVIAAPKLETLGSPTDGIDGLDPCRIAFGTTTIQVAAEFLLLCHQKSAVCICWWLYVLFLAWFRIRKSLT